MATIIWFSLIMWSCVMGCTATGLPDWLGAICAILAFVGMVCFEHKFHQYDQKIKELEKDKSSLSKKVESLEDTVKQMSKFI